MATSFKRLGDQLDLFGIAVEVEASQVIAESAIESLPAGIALIDSVKSMGADPVIAEVLAPVSRVVEDAGAELVYNRRNRSKSAKKWEDIVGLNDALKAKELVKTNIWLKPDYQALIEGGMPPLVAHMVKQVYDSVASKPVVGGREVLGDVQMQRYIQGLNRLEEGVMAWATDSLALQKWVAENAWRAGAMLGKTVEIGDKRSEVAKSLLELVYAGEWKEYRSELMVCGGNKLLGALQPGYDEIKRGFKAVGSGWPAKKESWEVQGYRVVENPKIEVGRSDSRTNGAFLSVNDRYVGSFPSIDEAQAAANVVLPFVLFGKRGMVASFLSEAEAVEAAKQLTKHEKGSAVAEVGTKVDEIERVGVARRMEAEDVSSERLMAEFGLKGVNFGNWMKTPAARDEAQLHLNHAFDSLHDLADILGVPPKAIGLNGMLGLAIGAQGGGGGAAAHFIAGVNEINLTRTNGAGSLAHEWAHALDHYFAVQGGLATAAEPFLTEHAELGLMKSFSEKVDGKLVKREVPRFGELRPEILVSFAGIVQAMDKRDQTMDEARNLRNSRMVKAQVGLDKWLNSMRRDFVGQEVEFDMLATRIAAGDVGEGHVAIGKNTFISPVVSEIRDLYKKAHGRVLPIDPIKGLQYWINKVDYAVASMAAIAVHVPQKIATDFATAAVELDKEKGGKPYWSTELEKFARAFDAFVSDQLDEKGIKNGYLSHWGRAGVTVPTGEDRVKTATAFKTLVDGMSFRETEQGVALFSMGETAANGGHDVMSAATAILEAHHGDERVALEAMIEAGRVKVITSEQASDIVGEKLFMTAWHGSVHDHDGFDMDKVETGVGAMGFGRGMYFSNSRAVGEYFRDMSATLRVDIVPALAEFFPERHFTARERAVIHQVANGEVPAGLVGAQLHTQKESLRDLDVEKLDALVNQVREIGKGHLYQVKLKPAEDEYLDWYKPLTEQSDTVRAALQSIPRIVEAADDGRWAYTVLASHFGSQEAANDYLLSAGVKGVKYLDLYNQEVDQNACNYVIFDESDVSITAKFSHDSERDTQGRALAFFNQDDGITYFVADHIPDDFSSQQWRGLVQHEIGVHALRLGRSDAEFVHILKDLETMREAGDKQVVHAYSRVPDTTRPEFVSEEALGYLVQDSPESSLAERVSYWFKKAVRAIGEEVPVVKRLAIFGWADKLSVEDLKGMAAEVLKGQQGTVGVDVRFVRRDQKTIVVDGVERPAQNSKGMPIHPTVEGVENFWRKMDGTKAVDQEGRPMVVFHATPHDFNEFRPGGCDATLSGKGIWFTPNAEFQPAAHNIGMSMGKFNEGTRVMPSYLEVKRPMVIDQDTREWAKALYGQNFPHLIRDSDVDVLKEAYDGIFYFDGNSSCNDVLVAEVIVFEASQIKSALGNNGQFARDKANILLSVEEAAVEKDLDKIGYKSGFEL